MTPEERMTKIEENLLVQTHLVSRFETKVDAWIESAETRFAELKVYQTAVLERIDRFIQGREENGNR